MVESSIPLRLSDGCHLSSGFAVRSLPACPPSGYVLTVLRFRIIKCSILAFYRRIAVAKKHYYIIYIVGFLILGQGIANLIVSRLECRVS